MILRTWLGIFLVASITCVVQGQGMDDKQHKQPSGNPPRDMDGKDTMTRRMPTKNDVCTKERLKDSVSEVEFITLTGVIDGEADLEEILGFICKIPPPCVRRIGATVKMNGTLDSTTVKEVICRCEGSKEVIDTVMPHVAAEKICADVVESILKKDMMDNTCKIGKDGFPALIRLSVWKNCVNIPPILKLHWPASYLSDHLKSMNKEQFLIFLEQLALNPKLILLTPCTNAKLVGQEFTNKGLLSATNPIELASEMLALLKLVPLFPFLPGDFCKKFNYDILKTVDLTDLKNMDWFCGSPDKDQDKPATAMGKGSSRDDRSDDGDDMDKDPAHKRMAMDFVRKCHFTCGKVMADTLIKGITPPISQDQYGEKLGNLQECVGELTRLESVNPGKCDKIPEMDNPRLRRMLRSKCKPQQNITTLDAAAILDMGCRITDVLKPNELSKLDTQALCSNEVLRLYREECDSPILNRIIARKCVPVKVDATAAENIGSAITDVPCDKLKNLADDAKMIIRRNLKNPTPGKKGKSVNIKLFSCFKDVLKGMPILDKMENSDIMKIQTTKETAMESKAKKNEILMMKDKKLGFTHAQKAAILIEFLAGKKISELSDADIESYTSIIEGMSPQEIQDLWKSRKMQIADKLCQQGGLDGKQSAEAGRLVALMSEDINPENPVSEVISSQIDGMENPCLYGLIPYVRNMTFETLVAVCERLGDADEITQYTSTVDLVRLAHTCWDTVVGKETPTDDMIMTIGNLLTLMGKTHLDKVPVDVLKRTGHRFSRIRCMLKNTTDYLQNRINQGTSASDADSPRGIWGLLSSADKTKLLDNLNELQAAIMERKGDETCKKSWSDEEIKANKDKLTEIFGKLRELVNTPESNSLRKRRAINTEYCSVLSSPGYKENLYLLKKEDLQVIEDFGDCVSVLGEEDRWEQGQLDELWTQYKKSVSSDICGLSSEQLQDLGSIAYSMTVDNIKCLANLDLDALGALGSKMDWSAEQQTEMLDRYMTVQNKSPMGYGTLMDNELAAAGHFLCALSKENIAKISPSTYKAASKQLGNIIEKCSTEALEALFQLAKSSEAYGPISQWTSAQYDDVCIVSAGMSPDDVAQLSADDIRYLCPVALKHMTKNHYEKWSDAQLKSLSVEQLSFVDNDKLSDDQKKVITPTGSDNTSGVKAVVFSSMSLFVVMLVLVVL